MPEEAGGEEAGGEEARDKQDEERKENEVCSSTSKRDSMHLSW